MHVAQDRLLQMSAPQASALGYISRFSPGEKMKLRRGRMVRSVMIVLNSMVWIGVCPRAGFGFARIGKRELLSCVRRIENTIT